MSVFFSFRREMVVLVFFKPAAGKKECFSRGENFIGRQKDNIHARKKGKIHPLDRRTDAAESA